jgi:phosphonopyruvate decarboxylase
LDQDDINSAISQVNHCNTTSTICILKKDTFSKVDLEEAHKIELDYLRRSEFLKALNTKYKNSDVVFVGTTGNTSREMYSFMNETNNFYMVGNMGGALSLGLGMAKSSKRVFVLGGDAEFVMHLGGITTAGRYNTKDIDLTYIVFDNEQNKSTGGQNTYQSHIDYKALAKNSNLTIHNNTIDTLEEFNKAINNLQKGINFLYVKCGLDEVTPRPPVEVVTKNRSQR